LPLKDIKIFSTTVQIRRELSEKGREHFVKGEPELVLQSYNRALLFRFMDDMFTPIGLHFT
jgi:hypothetical protein